MPTYSAMDGHALLRMLEEQGRVGPPVAQHEQPRPEREPTH